MSNDQILKEIDLCTSIIGQLYRMGPHTAGLVSHLADRLNWLRCEQTIRNLVDNRDYETCHEATQGFLSGDDR